MVVPAVWMLLITPAQGAGNNGWHPFAAYTRRACGWMLRAPAELDACLPRRLRFRNKWRYPFSRSPGGQSK
jgi:hypothetical protein